MTCFFAWALALLMLPVLILLWATESNQQKARRLRASGLTYKVIAERLSVSPSTARRWALA